MPKLLRKDAGQPIREAMETRGLSTRKLAEKTRTVDPEGRGVSRATIGILAGRGKSSRDSFELHTCWLVALGLDWRIHQLFSMPPRSTVTVERSRSDAEEN